jgi:glycosyltransferase involved in cell wall biosynthesis
MKLVVIIPALDEEKTIYSVIKQIPKKIPNITSIQVVVVNDGSKDNTIKEAKRAGAKVVSHKTNRGVGKAFKTGIDYALNLKADIIVNMDGDGQFDPKDISRLVHPIIQKGYDFVTCTRFKKGFMRGKMPLIKRIGNDIFTSLISILVGQKFSDTQCGFRAYSREAALRLTVNGDYTYTQEVFIDLGNKGLKMTEVPCKVFAQREHGKSRVLKKGVIHYSARSLKIIMRSFRDFRPLTFFGIPGLFITGAGLLMELYSFLFWIIHIQITPIRTYLLVGFFLTLIGLVVISLALIADMFIRVRKTQEEILYKLKQ